MYTIIFIERGGLFKRFSPLKIDIMADEKKKLNHIAFIPDGNRRWAKKTGKSIYEAYDRGIRHIKEILEWVKNREIKTATFWGFSTENFKRSEEEKRTIMELFEKVLVSILEEYKKRDDENKNKVRVRFLGRLYLFPPNLVERMNELMEATKDNSPYTINILLAYGGRAEIVDAVNRIVEKGEPINEETISANTYLKEDVDLIIRTGGEMRTSGYLMWESPYAEWYFSDKLWPEFDEAAFEDALKDYMSRERRFGK